MDRSFSEEIISEEIIPEGSFTIHISSDTKVEVGLICGAASYSEGTIRVTRGRLVEVRDDKRDDRHMDGFLVSPNGGISVSVAKSVISSVRDANDEVLWCPSQK